MERQAAHVESESKEAIAEYWHYVDSVYYGDLETAADDLANMAIETLDVIHAAETLLRMLEVRGVDLDAAKRLVIEKNDRRGYYDESR